jgi:hypothetical protein
MTLRTNKWHSKRMSRLLNTAASKKANPDLLSVLKLFLLVKLHLINDRPKWLRKFCIMYMNKIIELVPRSGYCPNVGTLHWNQRNQDAFVMSVDLVNKEKHSKNI